MSVNSCFAEDVESMTGEIDNGDLAVRDVADLLQPQYAIVTGKLHLVVADDCEPSFFWLHSKIKLHKSRDRIRREKNRFKFQRRLKIR